MCALRCVSLAVRPGEVVALVGPNGCGKSTLARVLAGSLPVQRGDVLVDAGPLAAAQGGGSVGYVRQDPKSQLVAPVVFDEVAFGPCNLGLSADEVRERVCEALGLVGLSGYDRRLTETLSGGEQQRLALAGVLAMRPRYLVLDEVTSMLDGVAREQIRSLVRSLAVSGIGVLLVTHCADDALAADRVLAMNDGRIVWEGTSEQAVMEREPHCCCDAGRPGYDEVRSTGVIVDVMAVSDSAANTDEAVGASAGVNLASLVREPLAFSITHLAAKNVELALVGRELLSSVSLEAKAGELTLVAGPSGSGKTTLARVLSGVLKPDRGEVRIEGAGGSFEAVRPGMVGLCLQRPEDQFLRATVLDDVAFAPESRGMSRDEARRVARGVLTKLGVPQGLWGSSVYALSGGEARLVAIAGVIAQDVPAVIFDEPTAGLDGEAALRVCGAIRALTDEGRAVVVVSHELMEWLPVADRVALLHGGKLSWSGSACELMDEGACMANATEHMDGIRGLDGAAGALAVESSRVASGLRSSSTVVDCGNKAAARETPLSKAGLVEPSPWRINPGIWRGGRS